MSQEKPSKEEHLFIYLISMFTESAWIALGKVKNPGTDSIEQNLEGATLYIDLLDMIKNRMTGNLSEQETQFLDSTISNLKLNYMDEINKAKKEKSEKKEEEDKEKSEKKKTEPSDKETEPETGNEKK